MRMLSLIALAVASGAVAQGQQADKPGMGFRDTPMLPGGKWHVHDPDRPAPKVVTPPRSRAARRPMRWCCSTAARWRRGRPAASRGC